MPLDCLSSRGLADPVGVSVPAARRAVAPAFVTPTLVTPPVVAPRLSRLGRGTARFLRWCRARGDFWRTARCCGRYGVGEAGGGWGGDGFRGPGASWGRGWRCCLGTVAWRRTLLANTLELSHGRGALIDHVGFRRARAATPRVTRPISTEGRIEDDLQIVEMAGNIAVALEMREWLAPAGRFGRVVLDIGRDGSVGEEPDVDGGVRPFCCVDATAVAVKSGAVGVGVGGCNLATDIVALVCSVDVAVVG
ncbi:hypothetical protein KC320_g20 [Hortaea werneckii]|nr:hypothetical protein KC320_g20 [Hortaea werneckii]